jgi:hypothetical protein
MYSRTSDNGQTVLLKRPGCFPVIAAGEQGRRADRDKRELLWA